MPLFLYDIITNNNYKSLKNKICQDFPQCVLKEILIGTEIENNPKCIDGKWNIIDFDLNLEYICKLIIRVYNCICK